IELQLIEILTGRDAAQDLTGNQRHHGSAQNVVYVPGAALDLLATRRDGVDHGVVDTQLKAVSCLGPRRVPVELHPREGLQRIRAGRDEVNDRNARVQRWLEARAERRLDHGRELNVLV